MFALTGGAAAWAGATFFLQRRGQPRMADPSNDGLLDRSDLIGALDQTLRRTAGSEENTGAIVLEINDFKLVEERYDRQSIEKIYRTIGERVGAALRDRDQVGRLDGPVFGVALASAGRLDLEAAIQLSARLQQAVARPIPMIEGNLYVTASVGFCLASRLDQPNGEQLLQAATTAMIEAERNCPGAIRGYSGAMRNRIITRNSLSTQVSKALDRGELKAFFQPQVDTARRRLTGFEALARWEHPDRGMIPPIEFLPALEQAGLMEQLGNHMVREALSALSHWDAAGFDVPQAAVNFSTEELRNPHLVDRLAEELDRFDLTPDRLSVEVLETVVAGQADDQVIRTLAGLSDLGCALDLDDFGTGHASITNIRRFSIERIKIDRSFVTRIDKDADQQMMFSAILTMAERLGLGTLAEGVETAAELQMLADLGCQHVQGYAIARPMALSQTDDWIATNGKGVLIELPRKLG